MTVCPCWRISTPAASAPEIDVFQRVLNVRSAFRKTRRTAGRGLLRTPGGGQGDQQTAALDLGLVRDHVAQIEHQAGALARLHHVHRAQHRLADILAVAPQSVGRIGKIERDPGRIGDREAARGGRQGVLQGYPYQYLATGLGDVEVLDTVLLRPGERHEQKQPERANRRLNESSREDSVHYFPPPTSCNCKMLWRSVQSPTASWMSSRSWIWLSVIVVISPKFWPM